MYCSPCCPLRSTLTRRPAPGVLPLGFGARRIACGRNNPTALNLCLPFLAVLESMALLPFMLPQRPLAAAAILALKPADLRRFSGDSTMDGIEISPPPAIKSSSRTAPANIGINWIPTDVAQLMQRCRGLFQVAVSRIKNNAPKSGGKCTVFSVESAGFGRWDCF